MITTVLSYGVGLSQIFFAESLDSEPFDAKIEFAREPVVGAGGYSNNTTVLESVCDELTQRSEIDDCTIVLGRQGIHGGGFFNEDFVVAQPLEMRSMEATNPYWSNVSFSYPELADGGPPISDMRGIRLLGLRHLMVSWPSDWVNELSLEWGNGRLLKLWKISEASSSHQYCCRSQGRSR